MIPRFQKIYSETVVPQLMKEFGYSNIMEVPKLVKIVVNIGAGDAKVDSKYIDAAMSELGQITGQQPLMKRAKKSVAGFKVREGMPVGAMVTLRGAKMWEFLDRLISVVLPRIKDFQGVSDRAFDGRGNYNLGLKEQLIFPEIDYDRVARVRGMNVSFVTTARTDEESHAFFRAMGMPFRK